MRRAGRPAPARRAAGFTLIELMIVVALMALLLLLVPPNLDSIGNRSRLESAANSVASAFTGARDQAILDGHEARLQIELPRRARDRSDTGRFRFVLTTAARDKPRALQDDAERAEADARAGEPGRDEWMETPWRSLPEGIVIAAVSTEARSWTSAHGAPIEIAFAADGGVRPGCAVRLVNVDLPTGAERTMTVVVNPLTALAQVVDGEAELPEGRPPSDFQ